MLDQNTDRMWFVIGALVVGAGIILLANKAMPEVFANVTKSFQGVTEEGIKATDGLDNQNYFDISTFEDNMYTNLTSDEFYSVALQLEPNTTYTASTNVPISDNGSFSRSIFIYDMGYRTSNALNGVSNDKPITFTTNDTGMMEVSIRKKTARGIYIFNWETFVSGENWFMVNKGDTPKPYRP